MKEKNCINCGGTFTATRRDRKYCSTTCRQTTSQRVRRKSNPANSHSSSAKWRTNLELFDRSLRLSEELYTLPVGSRLGYMRDLIERAREGCPKLRQLLSNQYLLTTQERWLHHRRCPAAYFTITKAADRYCRKLWRASAADVVYGRAEEPPTGEVLPETSSPFFNKGILRPRDMQVATSQVDQSTTTVVAA
jgi:hypothetical protein